MEGEGITQTLGLRPAGRPLFVRALSRACALGSNPKYAINAYTVSRRAPSATRTPLRIKNTAFK